ncbi:MAG: type II toxin-antitoxin system VapB family antitoxin [Roseibacillus sp.]
MRTTINIDDNLLQAASEFTGIEEKARLVNTVFERFVAWESSKRLKKLAGSAPDLDVPNRADRLAPPAQFLNEPTHPFKP